MTALSNLNPLALGYDGFVAYLQDTEADSTAMSPKRFAAALNLDLKDVAAQAHVQPSTLIDTPSSASVQRYLKDALRVLRAAFDLSNDMEKAALWYRSERLPVFGNRTAGELVSDGKTEDLLSYLSALEAGMAG